jgi:hypothetical protein
MYVIKDDLDHYEEQLQKLYRFSRQECHIWIWIRIRIWIRIQIWIRIRSSIINPDLTMVKKSLDPQHWIPAAAPVQIPRYNNRQSLRFQKEKAERRQYNYLEMKGPPHL